MLGQIISVLFYYIGKGGRTMEGVRIVDIEFKKDNTELLKKYAELMSNKDSNDNQDKEEE